MLAAIQLQIESIDRQLPQSTPPVREAAARIARLAHDALEQVRTVSRRLRPPEWQALALDAAIRQLWDLSGIPQRFQADLRIGELPSELDPDLKSLFYRGAQEAFSNLARHSKASEVTVDLAVENGLLRFSASDNGAGFNVAEALREPARLDSGAGLRTIRDHALAFGAGFRVRSGPDGTVFSLSAPLSGASGAAGPDRERN